MLTPCDQHREFRDDCLSCVLLNLYTNIERLEAIERELSLNLAEVT